MGPSAWREFQLTCIWPCNINLRKFHCLVPPTWIALMMHCCGPLSTPFYYSLTSHASNSSQRICLLRSPLVARLLANGSPKLQSSITLSTGKTWNRGCKQTCLQDWAPSHATVFTIHGYLLFEIEEAKKTYTMSRKWFEIRTCTTNSARS